MGYLSQSSYFILLLDGELGTGVEGEDDDGHNTQGTLSSISQLFRFTYMFMYD